MSLQGHGNVLGSARIFDVSEHVCTFDEDQQSIHTLNSEYSKDMQ